MASRTTRFNCSHSCPTVAALSRCMLVRGPIVPDTSYARHVPRERPGKAMTSSLR